MSRNRESIFDTLKRGHRTCPSKPRIIPTRTVVQHRVNFLRLLPRNRLKKIRSTRIRPIHPPLNVSVLNWVVMHIVHRRPKMPFPAHLPFHGPTPNLATSSTLLTVPFKRKPPMQFPQLPEDNQYLIR